MWSRQGGAGLVIDQAKTGPEFAVELKDLQGLCDLGFIVRDYADTIARRIVTEARDGR